MENNKYVEQLQNLWKDKFNEAYKNFTHKNVDTNELESLSQKWLKYTLAYRKGASEKNEHLKASYEVAVNIFLMNEAREYASSIWLTFKEALVNSVPIIITILKGVV